ncbi:MAG: TerB family tellurite resistance protein [Azospirillaceae bacterium]
MLRKLQSLFDRFETPAPAAPAQDELAIAAAALMLEQARMDDNVDTAERHRIADLIAWRFELDDAEAREIVGLAETAARDSTQLFGLTSRIAKSFDYDDKVRMVEMLWDVAHADGTVHAMEANLVRRIAGLLYVDDRDSGKARKRVEARYGLAQSEE